MCESPHSLFALAREVAGFLSPRVQTEAARPLTNADVVQCEVTNTGLYDRKTPNQVSALRITCCALLAMVLTSLSLSLLICELEITIVTTYRVVVRTKSDKPSTVLSTVPGRWQAF